MLLSSIQERTRCVEIFLAQRSILTCHFLKVRLVQFTKGRRIFSKAIDCYKEALDLAKKLKIPGILNAALFNRNIANSYSWLKNFKDAYEYAKTGYQIRKDILGNHPLTARSTFKWRSLEEFEDAKEYYEEAWEIEKSLGQGNHSEVRDRIIQSYEEVLRGERKESVQKRSLRIL